MAEQSVGAAAEAEAAPVPPPYYPAVDALRGFAASSVLVYHLVALAGLPMPRWYPLAWFRVGFFGVDLFFAISGAVIVLSIHALAGRFGAHWRREFARRRVARVVPLYLLTSVVFVLLLAPGFLGRGDLPLQLGSHLLFVHNWFPSTHGSINGPSWTLAVEMQFYAVAVLLGLALLRLRLRTLLLAALGTGLGWRLACWWLLVANPATAQPELGFVYQTQLPGVAEEFAAGMLAARWMLARRATGKLPGMRSALSLAGFALLAWACALALAHAFAPSFWTGLLPVLAIRLLVAVAAGLSVAAALAVPPGVLAGPVVRALGDLSYGIYLWHLIVLLSVQRWLAPASPFATAALVVALTLVVAWLGWRLLERPFVRRARRAARSVAPGALASGS